MWVDISKEFNDYSKDYFLLYFERKVNLIRLYFLPTYFLDIRRMCKFIHWNSTYPKEKPLHLYAVILLWKYVVTANYTTIHLPKYLIPEMPIIANLSPFFLNGFCSNFSRYFFPFTFLDASHAVSATNIFLSSPNLTLSHHLCLSLRIY